MMDLRYKAFRRRRQVFIRHKIFLAGLALLLVLAGSAAAVPAAICIAAPQEISISVDDNVLTADSPPFIDKNGRTMVPLRFISEALGSFVDWIGKEQKALVTRPGIIVELFIGEKTAQVNGSPVEMDTTALLQNGRIMVPLRFIGETFGLEVGWDPEQRRVELKTPPPPEEPLPPEQEEEEDGDEDEDSEQSQQSGEGTGDKGPVTRIGVVTGNNVNIRTGPGLDYERISQVNVGVRLTVLGEDAKREWLQIELSGGRTGWIFAQYVDVQSSSSSSYSNVSLSGGFTMPAGVKRTVLVMKDGSNIRSGPTITSSVVATANKGQRLDVSGEQNGWYAVSFPDGRKGWISGLVTSVRYEGSGSTAPDDSRILGMLSRWDSGRQGGSSGQGGLPFIIGVDVQQTGDGVMFNMTTDRPLTLPSSFRLSNPSRLVFDFPAYLGSEEAVPTLQAGSGPAASFRMSQFEEQTVRIVADLQGEASYAVSQSADQLTTTIRIRSVNPKERVVIIDPGHAEIGKWERSDPGAMGPSGLNERDVNRSIAFQLGTILLNEGYTIIYTREGDTTLELWERAAVGSVTGADVFISIHANASPTSRETGGTMTFYNASSAGGPSQLNDRKRLAGFIQTELVNRLQREDKGVREANFVVLRDSHIPAALVEVAYISNPQEEKLLADPAFQRKAAEAIALGIKRYLMSK